MRRLAFALAALAALVQPALSLDLPETRERGKLLVLVAGDPKAPVTSVRFLAGDSDSFVGIEGEILAGFASQNKLKVELVYVSTWDTLIPALLARKGDLIAGGMTRTEERRKLVEFTAETFPTRDVVITRKPHRVVRTLEQLREEQVGLPVGTAYIETVKAAGLPPRNLKTFDSAAKIEELMRTGAITATVQGVEIALAPQTDDPDVQLGMFLGQPQSIALAVRKEDQQLLAALNDYIGNLRRSPTWNRLVIKYFGERAIDVLRRARGE